MKSGSGHHKAALALLAAVFLWGSTFIATKELLDEIGPFTLTFLRFLTGLIALIPFAWRQGFRPSVVFQPAFLRFGLTGIALFYGLQNLGLLFTSAGDAALIEASVPAVTALLSYFMLKERITSRRLAGIGLTIAGVVVVGRSSVAGVGVQPLLGDLLVFGAVLSFAVYTIQGKRLVVNYPPVVTTTASFGAGLLFLIPLLAGELCVTGLPYLSPTGWMTILYLGIGASALTLFLWNYALQYIDTSAAALYTSLVPVTGIGFALLFGETTSLLQVIGGTMAIVGVWIGSRTVRQYESKQVP